jgi:hypothetical protein
MPLSNRPIASSPDEAIFDAFSQLSAGHISAVEKARLSTRHEGAKVSYEEVSNRGKTFAETLRVGWIKPRRFTLAGLLFQGAGPPLGRRSGPLIAQSTGRD